MTRTRKAASFGQRLRQLREARQWTMRELAERVGISHVMVYYLEHDQKGPSWATVQALAKALGVGIDELAGP